MIPTLSDPDRYDIKKNFLKFVEEKHASFGFDTDYRSLAQSLGIRVVEAKINQMLNAPKGPIIFIDSRQNEARALFTGMHEIAHYLFEMMEDGEWKALLKEVNNSSAKQAREEEEQLCNEAAAILLMPTTILKSALNDYSYGPRAALKLSTLTTASAQAALRRVAWAHDIPAFVALMDREDKVIDAFSHLQKYTFGSGHTIEPEHPLIASKITSDEEINLHAAIPFLNGKRQWKLNARAIRDSQGRMLVFFNDSKYLPEGRIGQISLF